MKKALLETVAFALCAVFLAAHVFAQSTQPSNAGVRLEAGIAKEEADGDLKAAMTVYQQIAGDSSAPRAVRAKALLRLGRCDEKLGQQARQVYEQILRDYADQPVVVQARTRLAALKQQDSPAAPNTMTTRKIDWHSLGEMSASDTDGQRAVYRAADGNLYYGDLSGHTKKLVFKPTGKEMLGWIPSRDFSLVALILRAQDKPEMGNIAIVRTDGTASRELIHDEAWRVLYYDLPGFVDINWSWDNRTLILRTFPQSSGGGGHIVLVSVADGKQRELASAKSPLERFTKAVTSPDGHFVAYEECSSLGDSCQIFVLPAAGGDRELVYKPTGSGEKLHSSLLDWTVDSRALLVSDVRGLTSGVFIQPVKNGKASGDPHLLRQGQVADGFTTSAGAFVFEDPGVGFPYFVTSMDDNGHIGEWNRLKAEAQNAFGISNLPSFSFDGKEVAYIKGSDSVEELVVQSLSTGQERTLYSTKERLACHYGSRAATIFCMEGVAANQTNVFSISATSGDVQPLGTVDGFAILSGLSQDDQAIYAFQLPASTSGTAQIKRLKLENGSWQGTTVYGFEKKRDLAVPSSKFNWLLRPNGSELLARPMAGGDWKVITSVPGAELSGVFTTTPDEKWVVYNFVDATGKDRLFRTSIEGGQPSVLGDLPDHEGLSFLRISPDGKQILAYLPSKYPFDLWVLSNFLPKQ
jgi:hypothetical protein